MSALTSSVLMTAAETGRRGSPGLEEGGWLAWGLTTSA
jgi:hypothetical protein